MKKKDILVIIETHVQFDVLEPLLKHIKNNTKYSLDIMVLSGDRFGKDLIGAFNAAAEHAIKHGFTVKCRTYPKDDYQLCLAPYIHGEYRKEIKAKYFIRYIYSLLSTNKAIFYINHLINNGYLADASILMASSIDAKCQSVFSPTFSVPDMRYTDFRKEPQHKDKPTILFAPTYNDVGFATRILDVIDDIKKKYHIIMHGHHLSIHRSKEEGLLHKLYKNADAVYDIEQYTFKTPLEKADIVLTDNASVIGDAIYNGVPVALFSKDPNEFHYRDVRTIQYDLVKSKDILWTNNSEEIQSIVKKTLSSNTIKNKQKKLREVLYPHRHGDPIERWMEILRMYLDDNLPYEYTMIKKYWIERIDDLAQGNQDKQAAIDRLNIQLEEKEIEIASFFSIKRSARLLLENIKRRLRKGRDK